MPVRSTTCDSQAWPEGGKLAELLQRAGQGDGAAEEKLSKTLKEPETRRYPIELAARAEGAYLALAAAGDAAARQNIIEDPAGMAGGQGPADPDHGARRGDAAAEGLGDFYFIEGRGAKDTRPLLLACQFRQKLNASLGEQVRHPSGIAATAHDLSSL